MAGDRQGGLLSALAARRTANCVACHAAYGLEAW